MSRLSGNERERRQQAGAAIYRAATTSQSAAMSAPTRAGASSTVTAPRDVALPDPEYTQTVRALAGASDRAVLDDHDRAAMAMSAQRMAGPAVATRLVAGPAAEQGRGRNLSGRQAAGQR